MPTVKIQCRSELTQVASGIAVRGENDITTLELTDTYNAEVRRGDRVLPEYDPMLPTLFYPTNAEHIAADGQVVRVMGSIGTAAKHSVVTIDRGQAHGVQSGHVFAVTQKAKWSLIRKPVNGAAARRAYWLCHGL